MDADRCAGLFEDAGADGGVLQARGSEPIMNSMRTMVVDKIASVTQACGLSHELRIAPEIPCEEGLVLVVEICDSATQDKGKPFDCKVLGTVLTFPYLGERIGVPAKVGYKALDYDAP